MKSKRLVFREHGDPCEVIQFEDCTLGEPEENEVLLENLASPINPADLNYIEGTYGIKPELPATAGIECVSKVSKSRSDKFSEGDIVLPISKVGGWAEHAITSDSNLIRLPREIDILQAAMLKVNPATAHLLLAHFAKLREGDFVVLNASNSGVGQCAVQLAAKKGVRTVCFLRNTAISADLEELGATHVFEDSQNGFEEARECLGKQKAKLAFNAVGGDSALRLMKLLESGGTHITYGAMGRKPLTIPNGPLIFADIRIRGLWVTRWLENCGMTELEKTYRYLAESTVNGNLSQKIDSTFGLSQYSDALAKLDAESRNGKILFQI